MAQGGGEGADIGETAIPPKGDVDGAAVFALDFETANERRGSPCAIGMAWIAGDGTVRTAHRLIRPRGMRFSSRNIAVHGIRPERVADKPEFPEIWAELSPHLDGAIVLAHNASFDMSVLRAVLDDYRLPWPRLSYLCTVMIARALWPELPNHRLSTVSAHLGISLRHHEAESDAVACASIARIGMGFVGAASPAALASRLGISLGAMEAGGYAPCSAPRRSRW